MKVADRNIQRSFFLKIALLANASPSKLIRLPAGTSANRLQVLMQISLYPHWLKPPQPGGSDPTPVLSRKRMDVVRRTRRHSKDLDKTLPNHFWKFKIEVTCQDKVRSKVKIGNFQAADRSDLKRGIFRPKFLICTPKDQIKVLTSEIVSYLAQVKVKVRSEKVTKPKNLKWVDWHMFYGPFWTKNSIVTVILQFDLIWTKKKYENQFKVRSKR